MIKKKQRIPQIKLITLSWNEILMITIFTLVAINGFYNLYVK
jgi:hypothetical protein